MRIVNSPYAPALSFKYILQNLANSRLNVIQSFLHERDTKKLFILELLRREDFLGKGGKAGKVTCILSNSIWTTDYYASEVH